MTRSLLATGAGPSAGSAASDGAAGPVDAVAASEAAAGAAAGTVAGAATGGTEAATGAGAARPWPDCARASTCDSSGVKLSGSGSSAISSAAAARPWRRRRSRSSISACWSWPNSSALIFGAAAVSSPSARRSAKSSVRSSGHFRLSTISQATMPAATIAAEPIRPSIWRCDCSAGSWPSSSSPAQVSTISSATRKPKPQARRVATGSRPRASRESRREGISGTAPQSRMGLGPDSVQGLHVDKYVTI